MPDRERLPAKGDVTAITNALVTRWHEGVILEPLVSVVATTRVLLPYQQHVTKYAPVDPAHH
jgi:hypothetical protein